MEYEKLYDAIDEICGSIDSFLTGQWNKRGGKLSTKEKKLMNCATKLKDAAHELEEHYAWDLKK